MDTLKTITRNSDALASGYDRVVAFVKEQFFSGVLKPGDMLLPERELAVQLQVSRPTVREALRALAIVGAVEILHGVGTVVRRPDASTLGEFFSFSLAHDARAVFDIMEARVAIECQAIRLACRKAAPVDRSQLARGLEAIRKTIGDPVEGARADFDFHRLIVAASRSETLLSIYDVISDLLLRSHIDRRRDVIAVEGMGGEIVRAHVDILRVIEDGDPDNADRTMRVHLAIGAAQRTAHAAPEERER
jgi:GntR family transcriptional regulator, transcriptional repressor for pyruvate dehydrogenase complex